MAMKIARILVWKKPKASTTQGPVYVLKLRSPPGESEEPGEPDVHFASWKKHVEGNNVIVFSVVVVLLIGIAVCFAFGTSSKSKAVTVHYDRLTGFTVSSRAAPTVRKQETQLRTKRMLASRTKVNGVLGNARTQSGSRDRETKAPTSTIQKSSSAAVPEKGTVLL